MRYVVPRRYRRVPLEAPVYLRPAGSDRELLERSYDLSLGGIFVKTEEALPVGATIDFELDLGATERIEGTGEVVWRRGSSNGTGESADSRPPGVGIRFRELAPGGRERIFQEVQRQAGHAGLVPEFRGERGAVATPPAPNRSSQQAVPGTTGPSSSDESLDAGAPEPAPGPAATVPTRMAGAGPAGSDRLGDPGEEPPGKSAAPAPTSSLGPEPDSGGSVAIALEGGSSSKTGGPVETSVEAPAARVAAPYRAWEDSQANRPYYADYDIDRPLHRGRWRPLFLLAIALVAALAAGGYFYRQELQALMNGDGAPGAAGAEAAPSEGPAAGASGGTGAEEELPRLTNLLDSEGEEGEGQPAGAAPAVADGDEGPAPNRGRDIAPGPNLGENGDGPRADGLGGLPLASPSTPPSSPIPGPSRLTGVADISWRSVSAGTEVVIAGDGPIRAAGYSHFRMGGAQPREVIRLQGIRRPYEPGRVEVGTAELRMVRSGYHPDVDELHVVLDLADPTVEAEVATSDGRLTIVLRRP